MIDKLLALAAVEHRQRIEQPQPVDLRVIADEAAERIAPKFAQHGLRLNIVEDDAVRGRHVLGDPFLLRQSLLNLLENAADFAPSGSEVELRLRRDAANLIVEVLDRGPGVPDYALDRTFERFYSLPRPDGRSRSSGLGLCFVAQVMELHSGRVALANREGGGAVASLVLPVI
jgi:two-component system, OmpR family, sensor histidine kinase CreC